MIRGSPSRQLPAQPEAAQRVVPAIPDDAQPRHQVDALGLDDLAAHHGTRRTRSRRSARNPSRRCRRSAARSRSSMTSIRPRPARRRSPSARHLHRPAPAPDAARRCARPPRRAPFGRARGRWSAARAETCRRCRRRDRRRAPATGQAVRHPSEAASTMIGMPRGRVRAAISSSRTPEKVLPIAEQDHQRHRLGERLIEILARVDLDNMAADHPHRLVVGEALALRDDDPVDHALDERQAQHHQQGRCRRRRRPSRAPPRLHCRRRRGPTRQGSARPGASPPPPSARRD